MNIHIESKPVKYDFQTHADENKTIALTDISKARAQASPRARIFPIKYIISKFCLGEIHTNIFCYVLGMLS